MSDRDEVQTSTFNIDNSRLRMQVLSATIVPVAAAWFWISAAFVGIGLLFRKSVYPWNVGMYTVTLLTIAPGYFAIVFGLSGLKRVRAAFAKLRKVPGASLYRCRFSEMAIQYENDTGMTCSIPYSIIFRLTPEESGILVTVDQGRFLFVPRESFATSEQFELASQWCLRAQLAKNPKSGQVMN